MGKTRISVVAAACGLLASTGIAQTKTATTTLLATVDHLVYATPDLQASVDALEKRLGVRAAPGGQHPGRGTRNALIALSPTSYIEIIGPDPEQPKPDLPRQFGIDTLSEGRLVTWAAKSNDLERMVTRAAGQAVKLGEVLPGSRRRPDGVLLNWRYTNPRVVVADGIVPFFIDWGSTPHPAQTAASGASLLDLAGEHPDAERVQQMLTGLGLGLQVKKGPSPALKASISSPRGRIELH